MLRHQLPVYSPLSLGALAGALVDLAGRTDPVAELGRSLGRRFVADAAHLFGSGTQALQRAIELARAPAGKDALVALPAFGCFDLASAAVGAGAPVVLYDLDPSTLSPDLNSLERACAAGARVVVAAYLYGIPIDWPGVTAVAAAHGAMLIEDAAQGLGAAFEGRPLGSLGPISLLSFGRGKGWTGGAGGALLLRAGIPELASSAPVPAAPPAAAVRGYAASAVQWLLGRPSLYGIPMAIPGLALGETRYHPPVPIAAMPALAAAVALRMEHSAEAHAALRRAAGAAWSADLSTSAVLLPSMPAGSQPGYLRFPLRLAGGRLGLADSASARLGIARSYPIPLSQLPQLAPLRRDAGGVFPGAEELARSLITLPTHPFLRPAERAAILAAVARAVR